MKKSKIHIFYHKRRIIFLMHIKFSKETCLPCEIASINFQEHFRFYTFLYIINFDSFINNKLNFKKLSFNMDVNMSLDILKEFFIDKSLVKTLMEYFIPRKLIG